MIRRTVACGVLFLLGSLNGVFLFPGQLAFEKWSAQQTGIDWVHDSGMSAAHYLPETMGAGVAALDYDQDGLMDLYFVNSGPSDFFQPAQELTNSLWRNQGDGTFQDVTRSAGVEAGTFGMGAAAADYDNDGYPDLLVTAYGRVLLFHNRQDGTFEEVSGSAGVNIRGWTTSAVWFDFNRDGSLDLFICNFVKFAKNLHISCGLNPLGKSYYCVPRVFEGTSSYLFVNQGDGSFKNISRQVGLEEAVGKALGVVAGDVNNDGWKDLFVANDTVQDFLFMNRSGQKLEEIGLFAGVGFSLDGSVQSGMGVDVADYDDDGDQDLFVSNIDHQNYSLFRNNGNETFSDLTISDGIAPATFLLSGWGLKFLDLELDGDLDLLLVNGHPDDMISEYSSDVAYREPLLVFENRGGRLKNVSDQAGSVFSERFSSRGMASVDLDNDGQVDAVVGNNGEGPLILHNTSPAANHWVGVRLVGRTCNREAIGARVSWRADERIRTRTMNSGGSYLASHDRRIRLGLGSSAAVDWVEVAWPAPSARVERFDVPEIDRYLTLVEGEGEGG